MKAIYYNTHGGPEVLEYGELPVPEPGDDQVLVQVAAASVNPIDRRLRNGELQEYITRTFPVVPGWDFAGRIVQVGANVTDWKVGDDVMGLAFTWSIQHGSYAEYLPVDVSAITSKPASISFTQAAAIPLVSLTAWQSLFEYGEVKAGQKVFIQAGAGGLGSIAIRMAKSLGAEVYTTARESNHDYVRGLGADHLIDYTQTSYEAAIKESAPEGVDLVLEALLGNGTAEAAIRLVKDGGVVVYMNNEPPEMPEIESRKIKTQFLHHRPDGAMLRQLVSMFEDGALALPLCETIPLKDAAQAHRNSEAGHTRGKVVIEIQTL